MANNNSFEQEATVKEAEKQTTAKAADEIKIAGSTEMEEVTAEENKYVIKFRKPLFLRTRPTRKST